MNLFFIAIGGAIGSVLRFLSYEIILKFNIAFSRFPWGTLFVNVIGSLIAGILYYFVIKNFDNFDPRLKSFLFVGFLGGFTTFSAFSLDFFRLVVAGQYSQALIYAISSVTISLAAIFFGFYSTKIIFS